jgi:hypothetical protein
MSGLTLPSGARFDSPLERLNQFLRQEYNYYDAIPSLDPWHISPVDVMVTVAMNSFVNRADLVRSVHRGMAAACDPLLARIPEDANLRSFELRQLQELLHAAVQTRGVLIAVATKVLHRKRRSLIPMLDAVVLKYYATVTEQPKLLAYAVENKSKAAEAATVLLKTFRDDLIATTEPIEELRSELRSSGFDISAVRLLELLIWTEYEPAGYYRPDPRRAA